MERLCREDYCPGGADFVESNGAGCGVHETFGRDEGQDREPEENRVIDTLLSSCVVLLGKHLVPSEMLTLRCEHYLEGK